MSQFKEIKIVETSIVANGKRKRKQIFGEFFQ